jgi:3-ketosteroid 9alpha-monooxygenase subunit B
MSTAYHDLRVTAVTPETPDCCSIELAVPTDLSDAFRYRAGQHLTVKLPWGEFDVTRCYSLSSCPDLGEPLRIAVKRVDGGRVSNWLNDELAPGDTLASSVPEGRFVLDPKTRASTPLFLFAGGSGITPIISLLKSALHSTERSITLLYANRDRSSVIYGRELERLAEDHPERFEMHWHFDSDDGYIDPSRIRALLGHVDIAEFYVCGPEPFMNLIEKALDDAGVHPELVYFERFVSPIDPDRIEPVETVDLGSLPAPDTFSLWLHGRSRTVPYVKGKTLLECARAAGLEPPHSCESGFCGSCMSAVKTGKVEMRTHESLCERDIARGVALLCQSVPASAEPLELDADSGSFRAASAVKSSYGKVWSTLAAAAVFAVMITGTLVLRLVE